VGWETDRVKEFFELVSPGFSVDGVVPAGDIEGIEVRQDGHVVAGVVAHDRVVPVRFTFDDGRIARVEVL
jgi:hypothetical protein